MRTARTKFFAVLLSLSMLVSLLVVPVSAAEFTDVPDWATGAVDRWTEAGIMEGGSDGTFDATHKMTRGEFAILMCKLMGYTEESDRSTFTDLPEDAAVASALLKLHKAGVLLGVAEGVAAPDSTLTREQTAVIMFRALGMKANPNAPAMTFGDADQVSDWAQDAVKTMTALHMLEGDGTNVTPKVDIPKQDMACLLDKMVAVYVDNSGKVSTTTTTSATNKTVAAQTKNGTTTINAADHPGAVIVKASKVTIESAASSGSIMVAPGAAKNAAVTVTGAASDITVAAEGAKVTVSKTGEVDNITMSAANTQASISGKVDSVAVEAGADSAKLTVAKGAEVTDVAVEAPKAAVTVSGTVGSVDIAASADNTTVKATTGAKVESVTTSADGVKIDGANKTIGSVVADAGSADVRAKGAEVSNDGAEVKVDGKPVTEGNTTTSNQTGSGTSTGGGSSSGTTTPSTPEPTTYAVNVEESENGKVTPNPASAAAGATVTLTVEPDDGFKLGTLTVKDASGESITVADNKFTMPASAVTVTATFVEDGEEPPAETKYTVTFNSNGGSAVEAQEVTEGGKVTKPADPTRENYTFGGWFTDAECTDENAYDFTATVTANITLYAKWTPKEGVTEYTVTDASTDTNGTVEISPKSATAGETITIKVAPKAGYELATLTVADDVTLGQEVKPETLTYTFAMPAKNVTVTVTFTAIEYTVKVAENIDNGSVQVKVNEGTAGTEATANVGDTITIIPEADENYEISKVSYTVGTDETTVTANGEGAYTFTMPASAVTVTAEFQATSREPKEITEVNVTLPTTLLIDEALPTPEIESAKVGTTADAGAKDALEIKSITWSKDGTAITVDQNTKIESGTYTATVEVEVKAASEASYTKADGCTVTINSAAQTAYTATAKQGFTVTFDLGDNADGTAPEAQKIESGKTATVPDPEPTWEGYEFLGWYKGEEEFKFTTTISEDITLTAKWSKLSTVTEIAMTADEYPTVMAMLFGDSTIPAYNKVAVVTAVENDKLIVTHSSGVSTSMPHITHFTAFNTVVEEEQSGYYVLVTFKITEPEKNLNLGDDTVIMTIGDDESKSATYKNLKNQDGTWDGCVAIMCHIGTDTVTNGKYTGQTVELCTVDLDGADGTAYAPVTFKLDYSGLTFSATTDSDAVDLNATQSGGGTE